jgi:AraC-like DNA-binding protein
MQARAVQHAVKGSLPPEPLDHRRASTHATMASAKKRRTFTHTHTQQLERASALYLRQCYKRLERATVAGFAAFLKRNPEYLTRTTRSISGEYLLAEQQIREAERLLLTTPLTVAEIALHAGFGTASTLHRWFKAVRKMSPSQFRKSGNARRSDGCERRA